MFEIAISVGIYAYTIFALGLTGILYWPIIVLWTIVYIIGNVYYFHEINFLKVIRIRSIRKYLVENKLFSLLLLCITLQAIVNFVGALGPELGFDALWYHLAFPKIYLLHHAIVHIPGGLLYYSDMPKLIELLYTGVLSFHVDSLPEVVHFAFGILTLVTLYKLSRKWFSPVLSILICLIFYSNLVVGWESVSAYIDLGRTFFELLALWAFFFWIDTKQKKYFYYSAIIIGLTISTKIIALPSLAIISILIYLYGKKEKRELSLITKWIVTYGIIALIIPLPWFVFAFMHTSNPIYPLFDQILGSAGSVGWQLLNPWYFLTTFWTLFTHAADPISPIYLILLPLIVFSYKKASFSLKLLYWYSGLALFFWYITPNTGGGRFILPYLPIFSLLCIHTLTLLHKKEQRYLIVLITILSVSSIFYRGVANAKFIPVIFHQESQNAFLTKHLNFSYGDFYDTDGYFKKHIKFTDTVLLYGFHNLYYVDFPFIDNSYIQKGDTFNYIAVQNSRLTDRFKTWNLIYTNPITHVSLYSAGGLPWTY